jgi:hypothetical protein
MIQNESSPAPEEIVLPVRTVPNTILAVPIGIIMLGRSIVNAIHRGFDTAGSTRIDEKHLTGVS